MPNPIHKDERLTREAREIAERYGVKAYEPPAETAKQEPGPRQATRFLGELEQFWVFDLSGGGRVSIPPDQVRRMWNEEQTRKVAAKGCECRARKALELALDMISTGSLVPVAVDECRAALADPCSCEQSREEEPSQSAWVALMRYAYDGDKDGAREMQQILAHYNWIRAQRVRLREQNEGLRAAVRNQARTISELQTECEKLQQTDSERQDACYRSGHQDATEQSTAELAAARSLLEEARLALAPFGGQELAFPDDFQHAAAVLAKIEAAQRTASDVASPDSLTGTADDQAYSSEFCETAKRWLKKIDAAPVEGEKP